MADMVSTAIVLAGYNKDSDFLYYDISCENAEFVKQVCEKYNKAKPVIINKDKNLLIKIKSQFKNKDMMGFLADIMEDTWSNDLPGNPGIIASFFGLSCVNEDRMRDLFREIFDILDKNGTFLWGDIFLPQSLDYLDLYRKEWAKRVVIYENKNQSLTSMEAELKKYEGEMSFNLSLVNKSVDMLYEAGFSNVEIVYKWLNFAVLTAHK